LQPPGQREIIFSHKIFVNSNIIIFTSISPLYFDINLNKCLKMKILKKIKTVILNNPCENIIGGSPAKNADIKLSFKL
jgi:hypothetical protein